MARRFILRDEVFGATLFDKKTFRYKYIRKSDLDRLLSINGVRVKHFSRWKADTKGLPQNLLYSPIRVYFETTRACNLSCKHCFNVSGKPDSDEMSTSEIFKALEGMRKDNIFDIRFTGGEFTIKRDWYEILKKAKALDFAISLNTNGVYANPSIIDRLASLNLEQITISIDGLKEKHDYIRGKGNFDKAIKTLKLLHKKGLILRTNTVLTKNSASDMEEIIQAVAPYVQEMNFFHMRLTGRAQKILDKTLSYRELYDFNKKAVDIVKKYRHINIMFDSQVMKENSIRMNEFGLKMGGPDGFTRFNLLANGSLWAGGYAPYIDRNLKLGNIKKEGYTILRVWRSSSKLNKFLNKFRDFSEKLLKKCLRCPELDVRCPGIKAEMELVKLKFPKIGNPYCIYQ